MILLWELYWPVAALALVAAFLAGQLAFRGQDLGKQPGHSRRRRALAVGLLAALAAVFLWHGPLGAGERLTNRLEASARAELQRLEMASVEARLSRDPLSRRILLSGPADPFQRSELPRMIAGLPGVSSVRWVPAVGFAIPVLAEAALLAAMSFLLGALLAYLIALRRRARADWSWL